MLPKALREKKDELIATARKDIREGVDALEKNPTIKGINEFLISRVSKAIEAIPGDSSGKEFLINARKVLPPNDYLCMLIELFMLKKTNQSLLPSLNYYHGLCEGSPLIPENASEREPYRLGMSRRLALLKIGTYAGTLGFSGGMLAKTIGSEQFNDDYQAAINLTLAGSGVLGIGTVIEILRNFGPHTANMLVNDVDKVLHERARGQGATK